MRINLYQTLWSGLLLIGSLQAWSQEITVTGKVIEEGGQPLPGTNVLIKGTTAGTVTDVDGNYTIKVPGGQVILVFSYIGYLIEEVPVDGRGQIDVTLLPDISKLSEIVVIGYGAVTKSDLTGSVSSIKSETLRELPIASVEQGIQGRVSGVQVLQSNGSPGAGINMRIRGATSVAGGNEPLYVIDGFPLFNSTGSLNGLASINPADIESIEVLKDASATAIYGSRGANGVVMITTKSGKRGESRIDIESYYGLQQIREKMDMMNSPEFNTLVQAVADSRGSTLDPLFLEDIAAGNDTDWQDEVYQTAPIQSHTLSFSGGRDNFQYYVSGNYFDQEGIVKNSGFQRGSMRVNLNGQLSNKLQLENNLTVTRSVQEGFADNGGNDLQSGPMGAALVAPPTVPVFRDGEFASAIPYSFSNTNGENPVALLEQLRKRTVTRILGSFSLGYELMSDLTARVRLGVDYRDQKNDVFTPAFLIAGGDGGVGFQNYSRNNSYLVEGMLEYDKSLGSDNSLNVFAAYTYQKDDFSNINASSSEFPGSNIQNNALQLGNLPGITTTAKSATTLLSWVGRARLNLKEKYLFSVSGRADGASQFGENNKWAFFPSASFAWRLSEEAFMQNTGTLSNLKLRVSWGQSGNQAISPFQSITRTTLQSVIFNDELAVGLAAANIANPDLKWETTSQFNVGVDFGLLEERVRVTADYYIKDTDDLLATVQLPPSFGFNTVISNVGSIQNKGFEFMVDADILTQSLKWTAGFNFSANQNEVTETVDGADLFGPNLPNNAAVHIVREGEALSSFFALMEDGYDENGNIEFVDINGDDVIDLDDRTIIGSPIPDFIYGFTSQFSYKNLTLDLFIQGVEGVDIFNFNKNIISDVGARGVIRNQTRDVLDFWTPENPNARYPRPGLPSSYEMSDRFVEDGSYLRLKNVRISYDVPVSALNLNGFRSIQVYVSAQNLLTITDYEGHDPEVSNFNNDLRLNTDLGNYPTAKTYILGINIGL